MLVQVDFLQALCHTRRAANLRHARTLQAVDHTRLAHVGQAHNAHCYAALAARCVARVVLQELKQRVASEATRASGSGKRLLLRRCAALVSATAASRVEAVCLLLC